MTSCKGKERDNTRKWNLYRAEPSMDASKFRKIFLLVTNFMIPFALCTKKKPHSPLLLSLEDIISGASIRYICYSLPWCNSGCYENDAGPKTQIRIFLLCIQKDTLSFLFQSRGSTIFSMPKYFCCSFLWRNSNGTIRTSLWRTDETISSDTCNYAVAFWWDFSDQEKVIITGRFKILILYASLYIHITRRARF